MIKELIKIKENNDIVSIFCDEDDTSMFLEGYIYAIGRQDFLIKHITPHGLSDGYILKKDRKSTRLNSSHSRRSRMPSSA